MNYKQLRVMKQYAELFTAHTPGHKARAKRKRQNRKDGRK